MTMKYLDLDRFWSYALAGILSFLEPINVLILWILIFIAVDLIMGVWASIKESKIITSAGLARTIQKFLMYALTVILLHGIDTYMLTFIDCCLAKIGCTLICGIELYSVFENCYRITGNEVFKILTQFTVKKIEDNTGVKIHDKRHRHK